MEENGYPLFVDVNGNIVQPGERIFHPGYPPHVEPFYGTLCLMTEEDKDSMRNSRGGIVLGAIPHYYVRPDGHPENEGYLIDPKTCVKFTSH